MVGLPAKLRGRNTPSPHPTGGSVGEVGRGPSVTPTNTLSSSLFTTCKQASRKNASPYLSLGSSNLFNGSIIMTPHFRIDEIRVLVADSDIPHREHPNLCAGQRFNIWAPKLGQENPLNKWNRLQGSTAPQENLSCYTLTHNMHQGNPGC